MVLLWLSRVGFLRFSRVSVFWKTVLSAVDGICLLLVPVGGGHRLWVCPAHSCAGVCVRARVCTRILWCVPQMEPFFCCCLCLRPVYISIMQIESFRLSIFWRGRG